jgi:hypothetical protein
LYGHGIVDPVAALRMLAPAREPVEDAGVDAQVLIEDAGGIDTSGDASGADARVERADRDASVPDAGVLTTADTSSGCELARGEPPWWSIVFWGGLLASRLRHSRAAGKV